MNKKQSRLQNFGLRAELAKYFEKNPPSLGPLTEDELNRVVEKVTYNNAISHRNERRKGISSSSRWRVLDRDGHRCQYCGRTPYQSIIVLEIDHIRPVSKGGTNSMYNLVVACDECNRSKHDHLLEHEEEVLVAIRKKTKIYKEKRRRGISVDAGIKSEKRTPK